MSDTDALTLPLPSLPGLLFRPVSGAQDAEGMRAVHEARAAIDGVDPRDDCDDWPTLESLRAALTRAVDQGEQDRWLVAEAAGAIAGYGQVDSWREDDGTWVYLHQGWVTPAWRGRGIGTALLQWCEARIRALAAAEHPGERWEFAANASSTEASATALLLEAGYTAPYTVLSLALDPSASLPETVLPRGITVRPVLPEHLAPIADCIGEAYADHPVVEGTVKGRYDEAYDPAAYAADLAAPRHDPTLWQVAWEGDEGVGQVLTRLDEGRAEVFEMSVRPAWRGRGIARALLVRAIAALRARGIDEIRVHTVQEFPTRAVDVYRAVGFRVLKVFPRYRKAGE